MKRLLTYLFIVLGLTFVNQKINAAVSNEIEFNGLNINTKDREFTKFGSDISGSVEGMRATNRFFAHTNENKLIGLIETFSFDGIFYLGRVSKWFRSIVFRIGGDSACNESNKNIFFEKNDYKFNSSCLNIRIIKKDELSSPNFDKAEYIQFSRRKNIIKKAIKKEKLSVSDNLIRAEHYFFVSGKIRWVFVTLDIDLNSKENINIFIKDSIKNHQIFEEQLSLQKNFRLTFNDVENNEILVPKIAKIEKIEKINKIENKQSTQNKSTIDLSNIYIATRFGHPGYFIANNKNDSIKRCQNANPTWNNSECKIVTLPSETIEMILAQTDSKKGKKNKDVKKKKTLVVKKEKKKKKLIVKKQKKEWQVWKIRQKKAKKEKENKQSTQNTSTIDLSNIYIATRFGHPGYFIANNKNDAIKKCQNSKYLELGASVIRACKIVALPDETIEKILAQKDSKNGIRIKNVKKNKTLVAKKEKTNKILSQKITTDQKDNEAPILIVDENIIVNSSSYSFVVKAEDVGSEKIFIQVNGVTSEFTDGIYEVQRFSPVDEKITLVAIDQWGNKSNTKTINIKVEIKDTIVTEKIEKLNPSKLKMEKVKNKVALIIGIENYSQSPDATFANLDAKYFYEYASKGFGIKKENIKLLIDNDATLIKSIGVLSKWLPSRVKAEETDLIIFFAGHGLASNDGKDLFLLSQDSDPDLLARTALSRTELFKEIIKLNPKSVTMFLDTCYSGVSRDEKTLLASARPVRIIADEQDTPNNFTIFSASQLDQISSGLKDAKHGIFSYYLMKGLEGNADANKDKDITNGELLAYMDQKVAQKASELGRQQNPSLAGDPDKILMSYQ